MGRTRRRWLAWGTAGLALAGAVFAAPAVAQNPFDALRRAAEGEARRQADEALRRAQRPPAPAPAPQQQPPTAPSRPAAIPSPAPAPSAAFGADSPVAFDYTAPWANDGGRETDGPDRRDPAAQAEFPANAPCRWLPTNASAYAFPPHTRVLSAEAQALRANVERVRGFFANDPNFATPLGVCMTFRNPGSHGRLEGGHALQSSFMIGAWPGEWLYRRNGRLVYDGEISHILGDVNRMPVDDANSIQDAQGLMTRADTVVNRRVGSHQGFAVHTGGQLIIALNDRPLFRPAAFERMARWVLAELDHRQFERALNGPPGVYQDQARRAIAVRRDLTEALARMGADERAAAGCFAGEEVESGSKLHLVVQASDPRCAIPMIEPNPDYFDRTLPRSAIQLITLRQLPDQPPRGGLAGVRRQHLKNGWMNRALFYGADWRAFRREVMGAR